MKQSASLPNAVLLCFFRREAAGHVSEHLNQWKCQHHSLHGGQRHNLLRSVRGNVANHIKIYCTISCTPSYDTHWLDTSRICVLRGKNFFA